MRDVAWAGAPDFRWDATSANGVLAQAYYQIAKAGKAWEELKGSPAPFSELEGKLAACAAQLEDYRKLH